MRRESSSLDADGQFGTALLHRVNYAHAHERAVQIEHSRVEYGPLEVAWDGGGVGTVRADGMAVIAAAAGDRGARLTASTAVDAATPSARNRLHVLELLWVKEVAVGTEYRVEQRWNQATVTTTGKSEQLCSAVALCAQP